MFGLRHGLINVEESLIAGPTLEPLDLDEVKKALKLGSITSEDTLIDAWISAARQHFETQTGRAILSQTWEYWLECFPNQTIIELPHPPLLSVTSIKYDDGDGVEQTMDAADYRVVTPAGPQCQRGRVEIPYGAAWPSTIWRRANAVRIQYVAGYGTASGAVPEIVKAALYLLVGHFHKFRAETQDARNGSLVELPLGAKLLMDSFRDTALQTVTPRRWCGLPTGTWAVTS